MLTNKFADKQNHSTSWSTVARDELVPSHSYRGATFDGLETRERLPGILSLSFTKWGGKKKGSQLHGLDTLCQRQQ